MYTVRYNVQDAADNNAVEVTRTVTVQDTGIPAIALTGNASVTVECKGAYTDAEATASDSCGGDLSSSIVTTNPVNTDTPGVYTVRYNVSDMTGNSAVEVTRTVTVKDTSLPVITLLGDTEVTVDCGTSYVDAGVVAVDDCDGSLTAVVISTVADVNTNIQGVYLVTYNVSDASGNSAEHVTQIGRASCRERV